MVLPVPVIHACEYLLALVDGDDRSLSEDPELLIRHDDGNLKYAVALDVEPGHLKIHPHEVGVAYIR